MRRLKHMIDAIRAARCRLMHSGVMYAGGDTYLCRQCLREHPVPWSARQPEATREVMAEEQTELVR